MKLHHYIIIFCAFIFSFFIWYNYTNQRSVAYTRTNVEYANALTAACHDAAKTIRTDTLDYNTGVWETKSSREATLRAFYETLSRNFGGTSEIKGMTMKEKTPFVILVDVTGFYISYNVVFDNQGNATVPNNFEGVNVISNLNTWSEQQGNAIVRYYLSDYLEVTIGGQRFSGMRSQVASSLASAGKLSAALTYIADEDDFHNAKQSCISRKLEQQINYLLNTQTVNVQDYTGYNVSLPSSIGEDWARMTKNPTVIAFMQGNQEMLTGNILNVYAYAAGELMDAKIYFIDGDLYYPLTEATMTVVPVDVNGIMVDTYVYTYNGTQITKFYYSKEEAAADGATPATY